MSSPKPLGTPNGEAEREKRRKKKNKKKKQTKRQEEELCDSFSPVNRLVNILPYPVTGFISGNFFLSP